MNFFKCRSIILASLLFTIGINNSFSKNNRKNSENKEADRNVVKTDSVLDLNRPQPYDKVITADALTFKGAFTVSKVKDKYYFEIPDSILDRDFQVISRITKAPAVLGRPVDGFAGKVLGSMQISFSKAPNNKLFIKRLVYDEVANDTSANGLERSLKMNNIQSVLSAFDIKAYGKNSIVIDVTDYINGDLAIITGNIKEIFKATSFQADRSYINKVQAYPLNVEIEAVKTYEGSQAPLTTQINTTFVLLPKTPMRVRYSNERVGYNSQLRTDFDQDFQRGKKVELITRWRLEPRAEDMKRYLNGELVEPAKPIVFYIDPTTPQKWVSYIKRAVTDWQPAFEQAGFKNAIYAKETTANDSCWNANDGRFSTIVYVPSMGSGISYNLLTDPRSGEILQANVQINHNTLAVLHDLYLAQAGAIDAKARTNQYTTDLMGELLRVALTARIGSSLGLVDNAGASSTVPVEKLRDKEWVERNGISPTIMQSAMFNYVAQPEDKITKNGILARVGEYDKWAITWGYKYFPTMNNPIAERDYLRKMIADSLSAKPTLYYGAVPKENELVTDPRNQPNDLGDNAVKASMLGIRNLKTIALNFPQWTADADKLYAVNGGQFGPAFNSVLNQYSIYLQNVANIFGTYYYNPRGSESTKKVYQVVPFDLQKKAMAFLKTEAFDNAPQWIATESLTNISIDIPYNNYMYNFGISLLKESLLDLKRLININATADRFVENNTYSLVSYLSDIDASVWSELGTPRKVNSYHMVLQKTYLSAFTTIVDTPRDIINTSTIAIARGHLVDLKQKIKNSLPLIQDSKSKDHYLDILAQIDKLTDPKHVAPAPVLPQAPQGQKSIQQDIRIWKNESVEY